MAGVKELDSAHDGIPQTEFVESFMVVFTDGRDRASRHADTEAIEAITANASKHHVFSVGLGGETNSAFLTAIGKDGYQSVNNPSQVESAFRAIAEHVNDVAGSYYRLDYCTPARARTHQLIVSTTFQNMVSASTPTSFDATGFTYGCLTSCQAGTGNCDNIEANGCEAPLTTADNCGGCGTTCNPGQICETGSCVIVCPSGQVNCGGQCRALQTDSANCGRCGTSCGTGRRCTSGVCVCEAGTVSCNNTCLNVQTDSLNCGGCGVRCRADQICAQGKCACPSGTTACADRCLSCLAGYTPNCAVKRQSVCCGGSYPYFCDSALGGGCWSGPTACSTIAQCSDGTVHGCTSASYHFDCSSYKCLSN